MATREEMMKMINTLEDDEAGWIARTICGKPERFPESLTKEIMWQALRHSEDDGIYTNGMYKGDMPCTRWVVGDYKVVYLTDDLGFHAEMLTEEMMDDLIIEEEC